MASSPFPTPDLIMKPAQAEAFNNWLSAGAPWNHIQGRKHALPRTTLHHRPSVPTFPLYQGSIAPSECDTTGFRPLPSDSGYESLGRTHQSIANGSIYGDRPGETASVVSGLIEYPLDRPIIPILDSSWLRPGAPEPTQVNVRGQGSALICPTCNDKVKTKSELK